MATSLVSKSIWDPLSANREAGLGDGSVAIIVMFPSRNICKPYFCIPSGFYGLVQTHGADVNHAQGPVWPAGFHVAGIFTRISHLVTKQNVVFDTPIKGCKTKDDVTVEINTSIVLRIMGDSERGEDPELVRSFVYNLGPSGLQNQLRDAQEEAVRALARSVEHTQVYSLRSANYSNTGAGEMKIEIENVENAVNVAGGMLPQEVTGNMRRTLNDQFQRYGVEIIDVAITDVRLPETFTRQMQDKTMYITVIQENKMKHKLQMQTVRYQEEFDTTTQANREEQDKLRSEGERSVSEAQKELSLTEAETRKLVAELDQSQRSEVLQIVANGELEVAKIVARKDNVLAQIEAEARATCSALQADREAYRQQKESEAAMTVAENNARAAEIVGEAEGAAAPKVRARRLMELQMKQLDMYRALAQNPSLTVSGNASNTLLPDMLVAQRQSQVLLNVNTNSAAQAGGGSGGSRLARAGSFVPGQ